MRKKNTILIVDDSEVDREILKDILAGEFELLEADDGYSALDIMLEKRVSVDAVLLDVSMPLVDGFGVLQVLRDNNLHDVSVFMITSEATKDNIERAARYHIEEFIKKPFDRQDVLNRVRLKLGAISKMSFTREETDEIKKYMADLERIYERALALVGKDTASDVRRSHIMEVFLKRHTLMEKEPEMGDLQVEMFCKAVYLCNIGKILLPNYSENEDDYANQQHPMMGADMIKLNTSRQCRGFVQICSDICLHHHERFDGKGFPQGVSGKNLSIYAQMCGLLERFDNLFFQYSRYGEKQFDYVINQLRSDTGLVSREVFSLLEASKYDIMRYYTEISL